MNVLQVCAYAAPYGGNFVNSLKHLEIEIKKDGNNVVYVLPENARYKDWCISLQKTNRVYYLPVAHARIKPTVYKKLKTIIKQNKIDIIHSHFELYDIPVSLVAPKHIKVFWHLHDPLEDSYNGFSLLHKLLTRFQYGYLGKKAKLLSVSLKHKAFVERLGMKQSNTYYLPNGIDLSRIKFAYKDTYLNQYLLFGWDYERKGVKTAIDAFVLAHMDRKSLVLDIVAGDDVSRKIQALKYKEDINKYVRVIPANDDVSALYQTHSCFLHISKAEGLSYALLEAVYSGIDAIVSDIPENEFAKEFRGVSFVTVNDSKGLAKMIKEKDNRISL